MIIFSDFSNDWVYFDNACSTICKSISSCAVRNVALYFPWPQDANQHAMFSPSYYIMDCQRDFQ